VTAGLPGGAMMPLIVAPDDSAAEIEVDADVMNPDGISADGNPASEDEPLVLTPNDNGPDDEDVRKAS